MVRIGFATKAAAKLCLDALHGQPMAWGQRLVADFDLRGKDSEKVSRAVWIGNVFDPSKAQEEPPSAADGGCQSNAEAPDFLEQLESDFWHECSTFGTLVEVISKLCLPTHCIFQTSSDCPSLVWSIPTIRLCSCIFAGVYLCRRGGGTVPLWECRERE